MAEKKSYSAAGTAGRVESNPSPPIHQATRMIHINTVQNHRVTAGDVRCHMEPTWAAQVMKSILAHFQYQAPLMSGSHLCSKNDSNVLVQQF